MSELDLYEGTWKLAQRVHQTPFTPKALQGKPESVLACVLYGRELGLGPMQSLNSIHVIEGRASASPELMRALVANAGHRVDVTENTNDTCVLVGTRCDTQATATVRWTLDDAKSANLLGKDNWKKYPRAMLMARATSELCRILFPDVIAGLSYTPEELESINDTPQVVKAEIIDIVSSSGSSPFHQVEESDVGSGSSSVSIEESKAVELIMQEFPGAEVVEEVELLDSRTIDERKRQMKAWGAWPRVRAIAVPIARGEGLKIPQNIDDLLNNHVLFTMVAKALDK